jgi:hypothetical protein
MVAKCKSKELSATQRFAEERAVIRSASETEEGAALDAQKPGQAGAQVAHFVVDLAGKDFVDASWVNCIDLLNEANRYVSDEKSKIRYNSAPTD